MSAKSTITLTRTSAERKYVDLYVARKAAKRRAKMEPMIAEAGHLGRPYMRDENLHAIDDKVVIELFHHVDARIRRADWETKARIEMAPMSDVDLENALERLNDSMYDHGGTENYTISERAGDDG